MRRREDGALSAEFVALLPLLLIVAMIAWQLLTVVAAGSAAASAARDGSRALATDGEWRQAAERSLPGWLSDPAPEVTRVGTRVEVAVQVPLVVPAVPFDGFTVTRAAELPDTS